MVTQYILLAIILCQALVSATPTKCEKCAAYAFELGIPTKSACFNCQCHDGSRICGCAHCDNKPKPLHKKYCFTCGGLNRKDDELLTSKLHVASEQSCADLCEAHETCNHYEFRGDWGNKQCFMFYSTPEQLAKSKHCRDPVTARTSSLRTGICLQPDQTTEAPAAQSDMELMQRTNECDWNGADKVGRFSLGGGGHTLSACLAQCKNDPNCKFSAFSSIGYCHNFRTCNGGKNVPGNWKVYEKTAEASNAVVLSSSGRSVLADIGEKKFNDKFAACPVVEYVRNGKTHSVYHRTSSVKGFNAYNAFTRTWTNDQNELHKDFEIYDTVADLENGEGKWNFCNYNDVDVGYPRDCGKTRKTDNQWFSMPGGRFYARGLGKGASFKLFDNENCPRRRSATSLIGRLLR